MCRKVERVTANVKSIRNSMSDTKQPYLKWHNENLRIFDANFKIDTLSISIRFGISYVV